MARLGWTAAVAAILAAAGGAWLFTTPPAPTVPAPPAPTVVTSSAHAAPTAADRARLQAQADAACRCARRRSSPWDKSCWADFERNLSRYDYSESATLCGDESVGVVCFGQSDDFDWSECVFRQRQYMACSDREAAERRAAARAARQGCTG